MGKVIFDGSKIPPKKNLKSSFPLRFKARRVEGDVGKIPRMGVKIYDRIILQHKNRLIVEVRPSSLPLMGGAGGGWGVERLESNIKTIAKTLRKSLTDAERKLWKYLRAKQIDGHKSREGK